MGEFSEGRERITVFGTSVDCNYLISKMYRLDAATF